MIWPQAMRTSEMFGLELLPCEVQLGEGMVQENLKAGPQYYKEVI